MTFSNNINFFILFSYVYLTISCQKFGVGIGLVPFPGLLYFLDGIGTGLEKKLVPEKVPESVSEKFGTEKSLGIGLEKNEYRKSLGIGLEKIWYRKKVSESVSFRFWVSSHTDCP